MIINDLRKRWQAFGKSLYCSFKCAIVFFRTFVDKRKYEPQTHKHTMSKYIKIDGKRVVLSKGMGAVQVNGKTMLQVNFYADGKRKRKFFEMTSKGLEEAKRFMNDRENERRAHGDNFGSITTEERRALELFREYQRTAQRNGLNVESVISIMENALRQMHTSTPTVATISRSLIERIERDGCSDYYIRTMQNHVRRASEFFGETQIHNITPEHITKFIDSITLENGEEASSTYKRNIYKGLFTIFSHAVKCDYISADHLARLKNKTECPKAKKSEICALSVEDTRKIFKVLKEDSTLHQYIPLMVMGCFCGLRSAERARVQFKDIYAGGKNNVYVSADDAKTDTARFINIQPNADSWLQFAKANGVTMTDGHLITGATEQDRIWKISKVTRAIFRKAGVKTGKNIIRHSAATYLTELIGTGLATNQLGHSEAVCRAHYKRPVSREDAQAYFSITPDSV